MTILLSNIPMNLVEPVLTADPKFLVILCQSRRKKKERTKTSECYSVPTLPLKVDFNFSYRGVLCWSSFIYTYLKLTFTIDNPQGHFPTYEPTEERISKIEQQYAEDTEPPEKHYDPNTENRARGAAFYQLPTRGDDRRTRIEELKSEHVTTQAVREQMGAINVRPGEVEGMRASESSSRASEKRKREIEDRRRLVDAKRKKAKGVTAESQPAATPVFTASTVAGESQPAATPVFTASAAAESNRTTLPPPRPTDPFAALEATMPPSNKVKPNTNHEADDFLAQLENGLLNRGR